MTHAFIQKLLLPERAGITDEQAFTNIVILSSFKATDYPRTININTCIHNRNRHLMCV